jgi:hypothetical protein
MQFDIFSKLKSETEDFNDGGIYIVGKPKNKVTYKGAKKGEDGGYYFSQKDILESVDLASASKYRKGIRDEEGQRKTYINIVNFYRDVMKMKINIDVQNYIFEPEDVDYTWPVFLMDRDFKTWAEEKSYDDQIDEYAHDLSTYGTTVSKKLDKCTERVPLRTIRITQSAKTMVGAAMFGGYVHIENEYHYNQIKGYSGWDLKGVPKHSSFIAVERYALVPRKLLENWKTQTMVELKDDDEMVAVQAILAPEIRNGATVGKILFMEEIDEESFPLEECHVEKRDGRWLGIGEIEKQLENQIARNLTANLRRRGLLWATKKIYQSADDEVRKNLVMEVKDGDVIKVKPNGNISQVNTQNQQLGDFAADENSWKENSQQNAFAFESATGESMPSGTAFRLAVVLAEQVASHFKLVRRTFSTFLKRSYFDQLIPIFKEEYRDAHKVKISMSASNIENLKDSMITYHANNRYFDLLIKRKPKPFEQIKQEITEEMYKNPYLFIEVPEDFYTNIHSYMKLNLVDDISSDVASLTTLYQSLQAKQDPRADRVLSLIFAKQGKALGAIMGAAPAPAPQQSPTPSPNGGQGNGGGIPSNIMAALNTGGGNPITETMGAN